MSMSCITPACIARAWVWHVRRYLTSALPAAELAPNARRLLEAVRQADTWQQEHAAFGL